MVHLNLCVSMILALGCYLAVEFARDIPIACMGLAIAQHYLFIVAYMWIFIESLCLFYAVLYNQLIGKMKCYAPMGWIIPAIIVAVIVGLYPDSYGLNDRCWVSYSKYLIMSMIGPILLCILVSRQLPKCPNPSINRYK